MKMKKSVLKIFGSLVLLVVVVSYQSFIESRLPPKAALSEDTTGAVEPDETVQARVGLNQLMEAFKNHQSKRWLEVDGTISKTLKDDIKGDRHQKFILKLANGHTVLVAHNIDLAPRVPLRKNDRVSIRARYEWSKQGGVLHWTHLDPRMHIEGGWIQHKGKKYR